ncbi:MAG: tetratricopeptide repeat protein [Geobacter sp.]
MVICLAIFFKNFFKKPIYYLHTNRKRCGGYIMDLTSATEKMFSALLGQQDTRSGVSNAVLSSGIGLLEKGKYKEAAAAFRQATALSPDNVGAYNMMAQAQIKLGNNKEAIKAYTLSLKIDKSQSDVHTNLANIYIDEKNYAEAEKSLKAASLADPTSPLPHYTRGHLLLQQQRFSEAEAAFNQTIRLAPRDGNAYYGLGAALNAQGRHSEAIIQLQRALELKRDSAPSFKELGVAYAALGDSYKVDEQISALKALETAQADSFVEDLEELVRQPKIIGVDTERSTFNTVFGPAPLLVLDPVTFSQPGAVKEFSITFRFDSDMDMTSVSNITNWKIGKPTGVSGGLYDNGLYKPTDRSSFTTMPNRVTYDPTQKSATVYFSLYQNDTPFSEGGTIDTKHLTFTFMGKDATGKQIDSSGDQYNGFADKAF